MKKNKKTIDNSDTKRGSTVLVCPPDRAGRGLGVRISGILCRYIIIAFAVFGLTLLINDSLRLQVGGWLLFASAFICCAWYALFFIPKVGAALATFSAVGYLTVNIILDEWFIERVISSVIYFYNAFLQRLVDRNFLRMAEFMIDADFSDYDEGVLPKTAMIVVTMLFGAAFVPFVLKRSRILVPGIVSTILIFVICTYNLSNANWAIAFITAAFGAILVLNRFDKIYIKDPEKRKNSAELQLFGSSDRPEDPNALSGSDKANETFETKEQKSKTRKKDREATLDEEISDYFSSGRKPKKVKKEKAPQKVADGSEQTEADKAQIRKLKKYDRISLSAKSAMGGFAGIATFALLMVILALPAMLTNSNFPKIPAINDKLTLYREYLTAFLRGDDIVLDDLEYARESSNFAPRSTDAKDIKYRGVRYFKLETPYSYPIYMPGWIATEYANGYWYTASYNSDTYNAYRALYAAVYDRGSTPAESIYYKFMDAYMPFTSNKIEFENGDIYINSTYGVLAEQVNIKRLTKLMGSYLYVPSRFNVDYNLRKYGLAEKNELTYVNFFDGIYTGQAFEELNVEYAAVSYMAIHKNIKWMENVAPYIAQFNEAYNIAVNKVLQPRRAKIERYSDVAQTKQLIVDELYKDVNVRHQDLNTVLVEIPEKYIGAGSYVVHTEPDDNGKIVISCTSTGHVYTIDSDGYVNATPAKDAPGLPFCVRYLTLMSIADKLDVAGMFYDYYIYRNYAYETYTKTAESEIISGFYDSFIESLTEGEYAALMTDGEGNYFLPYAYSAASEYCYTNRHEFVLALISHLSAKDSGYTYTLEPSKIKDPSLDGVENFLTVTKEGYCVQFASSVALLLREAGIPARYVEGYIASDFYSNQAFDKWNYTSYVKDEDAHAWVEVWYDGIGWVQYEATPKYYNKAYGIVDYDPTDPDNPENTETTPPEDTTTDPEDTVTSQIGTTEPPADTTEPSDTMVPPVLIPPGQGGSNISIDPELLKKIFVITGSVLLAAVLTAVAVVLISKRAERHRKKKEELLRCAETGDFSEEKRREVARELIDMTMSLLTVYGTPPGKCEFRADYANRITQEYLDVFGKRKRVTGIEKMTKEELEKLDGSDYILVPDTDISAIFDSIAAEEFGVSGMTPEQIKELAVFYKRLYLAMPSRLSSFAIFKHRYFKFI